jgi:quinol monooxygenase YgiN
MVIANRISIESRPGKAKELRSTLNELATCAPTLKGCLKFELYQIEEERERFMIVEIWKSGKAHTAAYENETFRDIREKAAPLIAEETSEALKLTRCLTELGFK